MFFDYIEKEWINSNNSGWYEGCAPGYPSTNNALEATNRAIKDVQTFKDRVPLSQFLERLKIILKRWSVDQISFRKYVEEPPILDEHWCDVIDYTNDKPIVNYVDDEGFYLMSRLKGVDFEKFLECLECDKGCLADCDSFKDMTFDTFFELNNSIRIVRTNPDNWKFSKCTCYDYFKTCMCKHILVIAIANNQIFIPEKYFDSEIGSKPKPGKKKKAKHWHERD